MTQFNILKYYFDQKVIFYKFNIMKLVLKSLLTGTIGLPTVMWHGMGDHAESNAMRHIAHMIKGEFYIQPDL